MPQPRTRVSVPQEPAEREADDVAARVISGATPVTPHVATGAPVDDGIRRQVAEEDREVRRQVPEEDREVRRQVPEEDREVRRQVAEDREVGRRAGAATTPRMTPRTAATITDPGPGAALPASVRASIEPHVGAALTGVRVHTGRDAAHAATSLAARAFTVGGDVFLNRGESAYDTSLMAHEATHVVQQGAARSERVPARRPEEVQRLPDFITDELADYARHIPGYTLLTVVIGYDPLRDEDVERNATNLVGGLMGLVPAGSYVFDQLRDLGVLDPAFAFVDEQLAAFDLSLERLERTISEAWDEMEFTRTDLFDYNVGVLERRTGALLDDVTGFASSLLPPLLDLVKDALVGVAEGLLAENTAWDLVKKVLHHDPLRGEEVQAPTVEILADFLRLIGKETELEQMRVRGTLQRTADWLDTQIATFADLLTELTSLFAAAWDAVQPENLPDLPANLAALVQQVGAYLQRVWDFAGTVASQVIALIKDALLGWLSSFAHELPGFHLLTVVLGRNPFTGEQVPRTAVNVIRGFITLLPGGEAVYERLTETGVVAEAGARIEGALSELGITWEFVLGLFRGIWDAVVSIDALIDPLGVFTQIRNRFGEPVSRLFRFLRVVLGTVFELLLALMDFPTDLIGRIVSNAFLAFEDIQRDPIGFLLNMLAAVRRGLSGFFDNFLTHLTGGLVDWLFRGLRAAGIEPPADLSLSSVLGLVLDVLDVSVERIWEKLGERFGPETIDRIRGAIDQVVGIWSVVRDVSERGVGALWEYLEGRLGDLWDTVLQAATDWIMEQVVGRVVAKLLSMLDPTGIMAVINGFTAFFNAVQSAIEYVRELLQIVDEYVATLASVAAGDIEPGAARVERGLASMIPVAIGFLANQVGLANIGERIVEIVGRVREVVDQALDWLLDRLEEMVQQVLALIGGGDRDSAAPDGAGLGAIDETVTVAGQVHHLKDDGPRGALALHSGTVLVNTIKDAELQALVSTYNAAKSRDDRAAAAKAVAAWIAAKNPIGGPGGSAPGIGQLQKHGAKETGLLNSGVPLWVLQSEHVIPFAVMRGLWDVIGTHSHVVDRKTMRSEDASLTTIMIYQAAAVRKNKREAARRSSLAADFEAMADRYWQRSDAGEREAEQVMRAWVIRALGRERPWYEDLTWEVVQEEHAAPDGASTRGARRNEATAVPPLTDIQTAATRELNDAIAILDTAIAEGARP
ncbi:DUF4157 domain-containing protein [Geodermatophilus sp. SYSU D00804]